MTVIKSIMTASSSKSMTEPLKPTFRYFPTHLPYRA